ncbi:MAG: tetraacyldisaccharide 4'-kinase [Acidobacteria bacterium]|nr:tetraacyldisaccharide 4'-kinase [Acidobacteriota bacterium]MDA1234472.1 tetraacyldisaccharide 4'-kinase [Acidobacteriota bacterium]
MILAVYNLAVGLLSFAALPVLAVRSRSRGESWRQFVERLGSLPTPLHQTRPGCVWLHCVSVGEVLASRSLLGKLRERLPDRKILLSVGTPTGRQVAEQQCADLVDGVFFIPYDLGWAVRRTFSALRPGLLIVMETEIWPNVFREAKRHGAGLLIANGRISDRSLPRYRRWKSLFSSVLAYTDAILAQSPQDAERFIAIGAPADIVQVAGNIKYDFEPGNAELAADIAQFLDQKTGPLVVAGSTREQEEGVVAAAFSKLAASHPGAFLVVAPRHPQRSDDAEQALVQNGLVVRRRSRLGADSAASTALLVDTLGELSALYKRADLVFVGGSLNGWGGHNVLEPALFGKPIVVGPHMQNFREIADRLFEADALLEIADADSLAAVWQRLLTGTDEAERLGRNASEVAQSARGAVERIVERSATLLRESTPRVPPPYWTRFALTPFALAWTAFARLRRSAYASGLLKTEALPRFTLCIGNITAGGTGKTPTVLRIVEELSLRGLSPAILTRGYGRKSKAASTLVMPGDVRSPSEIGDEPAILADRLFCPIGVGADRVSVARQLLEQFPVDLFVLDDGYQRLSLGRDFNLVLIDVTRPFETDSCLPLGRLREPVDGLARADAVLLTRTLPGQAYESLVARIRRLNSTAPVFRSRTRPVRLTETRFSEEVRFEDVLGRQAFAFAGIGNPESFIRGLEDLGLEVVASLSFADHHRYTLDDWWNIAAAARDSGAEMTITTQKDLVNLSSEAPQEMRTGAPPLHVLDIDLEIDDRGGLIDLIERGAEAYGQ